MPRHRKAEIDFDLSICSLERDREFHDLADTLARSIREHELITPLELEDGSVVLRAGVELDIIHSRHLRDDGSRTLLHLHQVSDTAGWLARCFYREKASPGEARYSSLVCQLSGLLHEVMIYSEVSYEHLVLWTDLATTRTVCALTPDRRQPEQLRLPQFANQVGQTGPLAQLVVLCDLAHDALLYHRLALQKAPGAMELVDPFVNRLFFLLDSLAAIEKEECVTPYFEVLKRLYERLDRFRRGKDMDEKSRKAGSDSRKKLVEEDSDTLALHGVG